MELVNLLDRRLQAIEESQSDTDYYKHIHGYIKFILDTPQLKAVLDAEEKDFYRKVQLNTDNIKVEQSNFHQAYFIMSYVRVYLPIKHYWNSHEPDEQQDPVALLLIWGKDHPRMKKWLNGHEFFTKRERTEQLKSYLHWFEGERDSYVREIKNLHLELVSALATSQPVEEIKSQDVFALNLETGDFNLGNVTSSFNVTSQEFRVIAELYTSDNYRTPYLDLIRCLKPGVEKVTKPDKESLTVVIRNIKQRLGILPVKERLNEDIIKSETGYGYYLDLKG